MTGHLEDARAQAIAFGAEAPGEHLGSCPDCAALVEGYRGIGRALAMLGRPPLPPGFAEGVAARIESRRRSRRAGAAVAALCLSVALGGLLWTAPSAATVGLLCGLVRPLATAVLGALLFSRVAGSVLGALSGALGVGPLLALGLAPLVGSLALHRLAQPPLERSRP